MNMLIKNGEIVKCAGDYGTYISDVFIEGSHISKIKRNLCENDLGKTPDKIIDAKGKYIIPGFIQSHTHICQSSFRGMAEDLELLDWLEKKIWPMEVSLNGESLYRSASIGLNELIDSGATTIVDMAVTTNSDPVYEAAKDSGIRAFIGNALMDEGNNIPDGLILSTSNNIKESLRLIEKYHDVENGRLSYILSPRFILSCSDDLFREIAELRNYKDLLIQTHASENRHETAHVKEIKGKNEIEYFYDIGILNDKLILAHCVWLETTDIEKLSDNHVNVAHCPTANLKLSSGIAKIPEMLESNVNVCLASDGAACNNNLDMFQEIKLSGLLQKYRHSVNSLSARQIFDMATFNGARALGLENILGSIDEGKKADLLILDLNKPNTVSSCDDIYLKIVYSASSSNIEHVIIDGIIRK
jgi:cytosine/adenosine deaminase-related metal-dependent hydrolase